MSDDQTALSVTVNSDDSDVAEKVLAQLEPYRKGAIERTRDFGVTIALVASMVALTKGIVDLWHSLKATSGSAQTTPHHPVITIEARDGAVLSLPEVRDEQEIGRFLIEHAG